MLIEMSEIEAKEVCLILRYIYDASVDIPVCTEEAMQVYVNVATRLQDALKIKETPWDSPYLYESDSWEE